MDTQLNPSAPEGSVYEPLNEPVHFSTIAQRFYYKHWALLLSFAIVLCLVIALWGVLAPFVAAFVLAYLMFGPSKWLYKKLDRKVPLAACGLFAFVLVILLFLSIGLLFIPVVSSQLELIEANLPDLAASLNNNLLPWLNNMFGFDWSVDSMEIKTRVTDYISNNKGSLAEITTKVLRAGSQSVMGITGFLSLMVVATLFIIPSWSTLAFQTRMLLPPHLRVKVDPFLGEIDSLLNEYIKGLAIVVFSLSIFYSLGLSLVGLKSGWAIGILAGLLCMIPYVGFTLGFLTAALELQGFLPIVLVFGVFVIGQVLEGFVLTPMVVGDKIGLSALSVVFALAFFGALFGLVGVILALPLAAIFKVAYMRAHVAYTSSAYYLQGAGQ